MLRNSALLLLAALCVGACSSDDDDPSDSLAVNVQDNSFSPASKTVLVGQTVTWTWKGSTAHSVTFNGGPTSPTQTTGSYSRTFSTVGSYPYTCVVHGAAMSGTITVSEASGSGY